MTSGSDPLDRLAPALEWVGDWDDVLRRARESHRAGPRLIRALARRRLVLALAVLVCVLIPFVALGAANDWWFLRFGDAPKPVHAPVIVKEGEWSGHAWQLVAYPSSTDGVCYGIMPTGSPDEGALSCAPVVGVSRTPETKSSPDLTITFTAGSSTSFSAYVVGPVVDSAETVEIDYGKGHSLRVATFPAPKSVGQLRFYAAPVDVGGGPDKVVGFDENGNVVACLVRPTAGNGSPLSDCR
jgi:hypothetical protein